MLNEKLSDKETMTVKKNIFSSYVFTISCLHMDQASNLIFSSSAKPCFTSHARNEKLHNKVSMTKKEKPLSSYIFKSFV